MRQGGSPDIADAVRAPDDILTRMPSHQRTKSAMRRRLHVADLYFEPA